MVIDILGFFDDGTLPVVVGQLTARSTERVLDTRDGTGTTQGKLGVNQTVRLDLGNAVPAGTSAVVLNLTATEPGSTGFLSAWPGASSPPLASNLNFRAGQTVPNLAVVPLGPDGSIFIKSGAASSYVVADLLATYGPT